MLLHRYTDWCYDDDDVEDKSIENNNARRQDSTRLTKACNEHGANEQRMKSDI